MISRWHPTQLQLEAWHSGEPPHGLGDHIQACTRCRALIGELESERLHFLSAAEPAEQFVRALRQAQPTSVPWRQRLAIRGVLVWAAPAALAVLIASLPGVASLLSFTHSPAEPPLGPAQQAALVAKGANHMTAAAPGAELAASLAGLGVALVRQRGKEQELFWARAEIAPGDELRVRIDLERDATLEAGILTDDSSWTPLFAARFAPGSQVAEATLRVESTPASGTLIVGSALGVQRARRGEPTSEARTVRLIWSRRP